MSKIIAFTGSNSSTSINDQLLKYSLQYFEHNQVDYIDLKALNVPVYSEDIEQEYGIPDPIQNLRSTIDSADALVVAINEHNGTMSAFFKNITDWLSRTGSYLEGKVIFLLSTSPGEGAARNCMEYTVANFQKFGGQIDQTFSVPSFQDHFQDGKLADELHKDLMTSITAFENNLK